MQQQQQNGNSASTSTTTTSSTSNNGSREIITPDNIITNAHKHLEGEPHGHEHSNLTQIQTQPQQKIPTSPLVSSTEGHEIGNDKKETDEEEEEEENTKIPKLNLEEDSVNNDGKKEKQ